MSTTMDTLDNEHHHRHYQPKLVLKCFGVAFGSLSFGYASAVIATTLGQPSFIEYMGLATRSNASSIIGAMNSLFYAGGFFGSLFTSWYIDRFGRKICIATACAIMIIASALCAGSVSIAMFIVFRFFTGWSCLMLLISVPLWITEVSPPKGRGVLANINAIMATAGYGIAAWVGVGFFFYQRGTNQQWRAPLAFACLWPLITLAILPFVPESPRYLLMKDQPEKALQILISLHHRGDETNFDYAEAEFAQMKRQMEFDAGLDSSWKILFTRPSYRRRAGIACALLVFLYSSGTLTISNYGPTLFAGLGYEAPQTLYFQGGIILVSVLALTISFFIVDRLPRNVMIGGGLFIVAIPLILETVMTALYVGTENKPGLAAGVSMLFLYIFLYGVFLDGPGYFYANEIFPTHLRAKGATLCIGSYSLINIMWTQVSPIAFAHIHWRFYIVFIVCCFVSGTVVLFTFPDTLGKPLEEVAALFGDDDLVALYSQEMDVHADKEHDMKRSSVEEVETASGQSGRRA